MLKYSRETTGTDNKAVHSVHITDHIKNRTQQFLIQCTAPVTSRLRMTSSSLRSCRYATTRPPETHRHSNTNNISTVTMQVWQWHRASRLGLHSNTISQHLPTKSCLFITYCYLFTQNTSDIVQMHYHYFVISTNTKKKFQLWINFSVHYYQNFTKTSKSAVC